LEHCNLLSSEPLTNPATIQLIAVVVAEELDKVLLKVGHNESRRHIAFYHLKQSAPVMRIKPITWHAESHFHVCCTLRYAGGGRFQSFHAVAPTVESQGRKNRTFGTTDQKARRQLM